ncbi:MAG: YadA C-terminal domain-containing protein [Pasteurellaceae bacterium]|nr:YadA C-terminal domain-containing protein [Pasteurellaceae bacterium]
MELKSTSVAYLLLLSLTSGVALAQSQAVTQTEFDNFKEETMTNVENVGTIALGAEAAVNDLLDTLYGKEGTDESGQLGAMTEAINLKADKTDLDNKADKAVVDNLIEKHDAAGQYIHQFVEHVNNGFQTVGENLNTLAEEKADKTDVTKLQEKTLQAFQEMTKAVADDLETKADKADLDNKADKAVVDNLIEKHDAAGQYIHQFVEHVNNGFDKVAKTLDTLDKEKADKTALDDKADKVSVDAVKKQVASVAVATYRLDRDIQQTQETVAGNAEALASHADTIIDLSQNKADKTELDKKADKTELNAKADKSVVENLTADVTKNTSKIAELETNKLDKSAFTSLNTDFSQLRTKVGELSKGVDANTARLAQLDGRITGVQKEMRRGFASQAALAGLFQPYNVGKVNVTAALGGYKSHTSLAVGAGYRFNQKVAAKAGLAVSTRGGSFSYNVGVNYEF